MTRVEDYYEHFPPAGMNVAVNEVKDDPSKKRTLVVTKDFEAGEVIYKEEAVCAILDNDLEGKGTYCSHCLRAIEKDMAIRPTSDRLNAVYCSKVCQVKAKEQSHNLLFGADPVLPPEMDNGMGELTKAQRAIAQAEFTSYIKGKGKSLPLLVARFVARQVAIETAKLLPGGSAQQLMPLHMESDHNYSLFDHVERLRFLERTVPSEEVKLLTAVLSSALPGLEQSVQEPVHTANSARIAYNVIGVCFGGGRDDRPAPTERPEDQEYTRTPYGTSRQIGTGFYPVSAYMAHSCSPSARPSFSSGTSELSLIATRALKAGDELTMAYVDVTQHPDESPVEARRRRRMALARGWHFKCECERCLKDAPDGSVDAEPDLGVTKDESKATSIHPEIGQPTDIGSN